MKRLKMRGHDEESKNIKDMMKKLKIKDMMKRFKMKDIM